MTYTSKSQGHKIIWVYLQKDSLFIKRDEYTCGRLTKRAIRTLQQKIQNATIAETRELSKAHAVFKILQLPNSRSYFLRKEQVRVYEQPAQAAQRSQLQLPY